MKPLLASLFLAIALTGCANKATILYNPKSGGKLAEFHADMDESEYRGGGVYWKVRGHRPSLNTIARGNAYSEFVKAGTDGARTFGGGIR